MVGETVGMTCERQSSGRLPGGQEKALQMLTFPEASTWCCPGGVGFLGDFYQRTEGSGGRGWSRWSILSSTFLLQLQLLLFLMLSLLDPVARVDVRKKWQETAEETGGRSRRGDGRVGQGDKRQQLADRDR